MDFIKFRKSIGILIISALFLSLFLVTPAVEANTGHKNPVVFVHGFFDSKSDLFGKSNFTFLINYLVDQGWDRNELFVIQYTDAVGSNIPNASELDVFINNVLSQTGKTKVDIVAHSMGGLSSRYYIQNLGGHAKVGSLVTLGSPHKGAPLANLVAWTGGGYEMIPNSTFLQQLNSGNITPGSVRYTSIYTYPDEMVPYANTQLSGWNNIGGWYNMHLTMLFHSSVHNHVKNNLTQ